MRSKSQFSVKLILVLHILAAYSFSQVVIDGEFIEPEYLLLASKMNNNSSFGNAVDVSNIYYAVDEHNLYLGFECKVQNTPNDYNPKPDGVGVLLNFTSENGASPGTPLGFDIYQDYHFINGGLETGWQNSDYKADFEVDYQLAFYSDGSPSTIFFDAASNVISSLDSVQSIATTNQMGTPSSGPSYDGVFSSHSIVFAYQQSTGAGSFKGAEVQIPLTEVNAESYDQFQLFSFVSAGTAYFSNVTIPGTVTGASSGANPDYHANLNSENCGCPAPGATIGIGPYHTDLVDLGESRAVIRTVPSDTIAFGELFLGDVDTLILEVMNVGSELLEVTGIQLSGEAFTADQTPFSLASGEQLQIEVMFEPVVAQEYFGNLSIASNDTVDPIVDITLSGAGTLAPDLSLDPDSLNVSLFSGASSILTVTLDNTLGQGALHWQAGVTNSQQMTSLTFTKSNYADWSLPENQDRITDNVWITRDDNGGIFNAATESYFTDFSPSDTRWAFGLSADLEPEDYQYWRQAVSYYPPGMVDRPISIYLITDDIYLDLIFHSWTSGNQGGGFSYTRTLPMPTWLNLVEENGSVAAGITSELEVAIDATGLEPGDHYADILISSNDPDTPQLALPVHLEVVGAPDFFTTADTLDFGYVYLNYPDTLTMVIQNLGSENLLLNHAAVDLPEYHVDPTTGEIPPVGEASLEISFSPTSLGSYPGVLTLTTSDPDEGTISITLLGEALEPPIISVTPESFEEALNTEETSLRSLSISNTGASELVYEISARAVNILTRERTLELASLSNAPRLSWSDLQAIQSSFRGAARPIKEKRHDSMLESQPGIQNSRELRENWELLYTDANEDEISIDIHQVYVNTTLDELLFKLTSYQAWADPLGNTGAIIYIDADQDINTGLDTEEEDAIGWFLGVDYVILRSGFDGDGLLFWDEFGEDFVWIDDLTTSTAEYDSDEIIVGVDLDHFQEYSGINFAMMAGSFIEQLDAVPDPYDGHIEYLFSPSWLIFDPEDGIIEPGSTGEISVTFDAVGMYGGSYLADITILNNDPVIPVVSIPVSFDVTGTPDIHLEVDNLGFGDVFVGYESDVSLEIFNMGTDSLIIGSISSTNQAFSISPTSVELSYGESTLIHASITATEPIQYSGEININSNDPDEAAISIPVHATALIPPQITASPSMVNFDMSLSDGLRDTVRIANIGGSELSYSVRHQYPQGVLRDAGGPDEFGYTWRDSDDPTGPQFDWMHDENAIYFPVEDDGSYSGIPLGFNFDYYGSIYSTINFMYNGWLSFTSSDSWFPNEVPVMDDPWAYGGAIAPFAGDLYPQFSPSYTTLGEAPNRMFIVEYNSSWCCSGPPFMSFEVILYETSNRIRFQYLSLDGQIPEAIGIANDDNSTGLGNGGMNATFIDPSIVRDNYAIEFSQQVDWLSIQPPAGSVAVGSTGELDVLVNTDGLDTGDYLAELIISSNDPENPEIMIPVSLYVAHVGVEDKELLPDSYVLNQNYPNPFNPSTTISYGLPLNSDVSLVIYNVKGQVVQTFEPGYQVAGWYDITWSGQTGDGRMIPTGIYFARLVAGNYSRVIKMLYLK